MKEISWKEAMELWLEGFTVVCKVGPIEEVFHKEDFYKITIQKELFTKGKWYLKGE